MTIILSNELREILKMEYKTCSKCKVSKLVGDFTKSKNTKDGFHNQCKQCNKEYCLANKNKIAEYNLANKDKKAEYDREYCLANKDKIAEYNREYNLANKDKVAECNKEYNLANKDKIAEYNREYNLALSDNYVLSCIKKSTEFPPNAEIPAELIEAKRLDIKIKRLLKEIKK